MWENWARPRKFVTWSTKLLHFPQMLTIRLHTKCSAPWASHPSRPHGIHPDTEALLPLGKDWFFWGLQGLPGLFLENQLSPQMCGKQRILSWVEQKRSNARLHLGPRGQLLSGPRVCVCVFPGPPDFKKLPQEMGSVDRGKAKCQAQCSSQVVREWFGGWCGGQREVKKESPLSLCLGRLKSLQRPGI